MDKVQIHWDTEVTEFQGASRAGSPGTRNVKTGETTTLPVTGVFIAIGMVPNTAWLKDLLPLDEWGFIFTDLNMATAIPGHFCRRGCPLQTGAANLHRGG